MSECVVYWLHDAYCTHVQKHGYVGISTNWWRRLASHQKNKQFPLFDWSIVFIGTRVECLLLERQLRPEIGIGWNQSVGGKPIVNFTPEVRAKMSKSAKSKPKISEETRGKLCLTSTGRTNKGRLGQKKSDKECDKISKNLTGRKLSAEHIKKLAAVPHEARHITPHSEEARLKISLKKLGVPIHSDEHKAKLSERMKGNSYTKGKPWSLARRLAHQSKEH